MTSPPQNQDDAGAANSVSPDSFARKNCARYHEAAVVEAQLPLSWNLGIAGCEKIPFRYIKPEKIYISSHTDIRAHKLSDITSMRLDTKRHSAPAAIWMRRPTI